MQRLRTVGFLMVSVLCLFVVAVTATGNDPKASTKAKFIQQQLVEKVDIQGNRRLRDEDLLYYIKTREGDVYDPRQLERDLKELLSLNFFDKTATKVLTEEGLRGGVSVIFEVKELPIIRDLQFTGSKAVPESEILKQFREKRIGISKEAVFDPVKVNGAKRLLREMLASKGYPNATINEEVEEVSATSVAVNFRIDAGKRSRIVKIEFEGNEHFKDGELRGALMLVRETGLISRFKGQDILDMRKLQYDLEKNVRQLMFSKGYFQARIGEPQVVGLGYKRTSFVPLIVLPLPLISSKDDTLKIIVPISEGRIFRVGDVKVEGNSIISEDRILTALSLKKGEIADGKQLRKVLYEDLKKFYGSQGFVLYEPNLDMEYRDNPTNPKEGIVDVKIEIDEGKQFRLRRLEFTGNTFTRDRVMRREFLMNEGDIYNQVALENSVIRINQTGYFDPVDKDQDVTIRTADETGDVDLVVAVKEKGRQQIQFNGGVSGLGGSFFGLEYSTNNLLGRGEIFSLQAGLGNRQTSIQASFTEPYFRNRPITVGASLFYSTYKFFGEGTFLSQNQSLFLDASNPYGSITTDQSNLFTQKTYGASLFATAPLSEFFFKKRKFTQFSRLGLTYQFSATTITDPPVNQTGDATRLIPVIFRQPNIITSRVTPTFAYDTRQPASNGIDTLRGRQLTASVGFAGLAGDVRTYSPQISFSQFFPIRRRKSKSAEVFGFRILAGTLQSFATSSKIRNANSLSFIGGVPYYERFFLGSENDIRGYNVRTIGPIAPINTYVTSRNVVVATNATGTPVLATGLSDRDRNELISIGTFTGASGANPGLIGRDFRIIGGDTQLLGNFEYRIPIFGPVSLAAFADIGSAFNLKKGGDQFINSTFLPDQPFLGFNSLSTVFFRGNTELQPSFFGGFLLRNGRPITRSQFVNDFCNNDISSCPVIPPTGLQQVFLRGDAQTNQVIKIGDSVFSRLGDFRSSVGMELRVQVPVVNVPFRLIYYYNPNAKLGITPELPNFFLPGKRNGFRFTVGRTF